MVMVNVQREEFNHSVWTSSRTLKRKLYPKRREAHQINCAGAGWAGGVDGSSGYGGGGILSGGDEEEKRVGDSDGRGGQ